MKQQDIRRAVVAGKFYPGAPEALREAVTGYMEESGVTPAPERVAAIVSPHAGYVYSGPTAGHVFARVRGKAPRRVVLLGRSHQYGFDGFQVRASGAFETPLGLVPVDEAFAKELGGSGDSKALAVHLSEHALEVQLPFLQVALGDVPIVPVLFGADPDASHVRLGERLAGMMAEEDLVVASTDLSHYHSEKEANRIDRYSIERVLAQDCGGLARELAAETCSMCGGTAVVAAMAYAGARHADDWQLLDYRTSGLASGDYSRVVGYGAVSMEHAA